MIKETKVFFHYQLKNGEIKEVKSEFTIVPNLDDIICFDINFEDNVKDTVFYKVMQRHFSSSTNALIIHIKNKF